MDNKIIAIHQPNFAPWLGYFYKIMKCDTFVFLDDVQFTKNSYINRNKIKSPNGEQWLTIPVLHRGNYGQNINEILIKSKEKTRENILKTLMCNYSKAPYYQAYIDEILNIFLTTSEKIFELNIELIKFFSSILGLKSKFYLSSELNDVQGTSTQKLISICKNFEATEYLSGFGAINYQDEKLFQNENITLKISEFAHPIYSQRWGPFIPNLSIFDFIFNCGTNSAEILFSSQNA